MLLIYFLNQQNQGKTILPTLNKISKEVTKLKYKSFENIIAAAYQNPSEMRSQKDYALDFYKKICFLEKEIEKNLNRQFLHDTLNWLFDKNHNDVIILSPDEYNVLSPALLQLADLTLIQIYDSTIVKLNCRKIDFYNKHCKKMPIEQLQNLWS